MTSPSSPAQGDHWVRVMPVVFVLIWSTGFVVARLAMPHAPPMSFLGWRYALSVGLFLGWVSLSGAAWPHGRGQVLHLAISGVLMHAGYLGGVWAAVKLGLGAGTAALIVGLQPVLTAAWLSRPGAAHPVEGRQWLGLVMGLAGLLLVVQQRLGAGQATVANLLLAVLALVSITAGTLYQKRWVAPCDVRSAAVVQLLAAFVVTAPLSLLETEPVNWHPDLLIAMAWSVLALTLGGSSLLYLLIQRGAATQVSSLMYLVPPCTAVLAWVMFDEPVSASVVAGMALTAAGVGLVLRSGR
jgi:drug/metabolite transporter (DMT)-like permease